MYQFIIYSDKPHLTTGVFLNPVLLAGAAFTTGLHGCFIEARSMQDSVQEIYLMHAYQRLQVTTTSASQLTDWEVSGASRILSELTPINLTLVSDKHPQTFTTILLTTVTKQESCALNGTCIRGDGLHAGILYKLWTSSLITKANRTQAKLLQWEVVAYS